MALLLNYLKPISLNVIWSFKTIVLLFQFDKSINNALSTRVKVKVAFKAEKLNTYRFCDNVWTFMLNDVEFRDSNELEKVDRVKVKSDFLIVQGTILTKQ